jgi:hypothetical protein
MRFVVLVFLLAALCLDTASAAGAQAFRPFAQLLASRHARARASSPEAPKVSLSSSKEQNGILRIAYIGCMRVNL